MLIRKKYQCPLCERYVCSSCVTERVELDPVFFNEEAVTIMVCKNCKLYVQQGEEKQQFEEALERADNHPLVYYHGILSEILQLLSTLLPKFTDMVLAEDVSVENLKAAGKLEVHLLELFRNFDIGVKKVVAIPLEDPRDKRIQANIKLSLVNFLQENLMKFKALQKQRKELLAQAMEDERSGKKKISSKNDKGVGDTEREPFIISFEPAMSPMAGTIISIHGENFFKDTVVLIDGAKCKTKFVAKDNLICQSPILFEEGLKDIEVINPDKRCYKLSRVLFYSQDKELFSKQSKVQTNPEGQGRTGMSDKGKETAGSALSSLAGIEGKEHDSLQELVATMPDSEVLLNTTSAAAGSVASGKPSQRSFIEDSSLPGPPNIRMVHPAISPLQGTQIRLTGDNFSSGSRVLVGGKEATQVQLLERATSSNSCVLQMQSPPLAAGQHKVEIINPGGARFVLDGVLFYTDDPVLVGPASPTTSNKQHTIARQTPAAKTRQAASPTRVSSEAGTRSTSLSTRASATAASTPPATPNRWASTYRQQQTQPTNRAQMSPHPEAGNGVPLSEEKEREEDGYSGPLSTGMSFRAGFSGSGHKRNKSKGVSSWGW